MNLFTLFTHSLLLAASVSIDFDDLKEMEFQEQWIQVRGFAYQTQNGEWILSADPQLRSCCVGSVAKQKEQIYLEGDFEDLPVSKAIVMEGFLQNKHSSERPQVRLTQAREMKKSSFPFLTSAVGVLLAGGSLLFFKIKKKG